MVIYPILALCSFFTHYKEGIEMEHWAKMGENFTELVVDFLSNSTYNKLLPKCKLLYYC